MITHIPPNLLAELAKRENMLVLASFSRSEMQESVVEAALFFYESSYRNKVFGVWEKMSERSRKELLEKLNVEKKSNMEYIARKCSLWEPSWFNYLVWVKSSAVDEIVFDVKLGELLVASSMPLDQPSSQWPSFR